jgi:hypothetical protein
MSVTYYLIVDVTPLRRTKISDGGFQNAIRERVSKKLRHLRGRGSGGPHHGPGWRVQVSLDHSLSSISDRPLGLVS